MRLTRCVSSRARSPSSRCSLVARSCAFFVGWLLLLVAVAAAARGGRSGSRSCVVGLFRALGATFIKVGQIMSTRPDLFPPHVIHALETLQDNVGPVPFAQVQRTLRRGSRAAARGDVRRVRSRRRSPRPRWRRCTRRGCPTGAWWRSRCAGPRSSELVELRPQGDARVRAADERWCRRSRLLAPVESVERVRARHPHAARLHHRGRQQPPLPRQLRRRSRRHLPRARRRAVHAARAGDGLHRRRRRSSTSARRRVRPRSGSPRSASACC